MNVETGQRYSSLEEALKQGENPADMVEISGKLEAIERLSARLKQQEKARRRAADKRARASRKRNRS